MAKHIAIFGLSANPPTGNGGHRGIVEYLKNTNRFDEIWIFPVYQHMFAAKRNLESFCHRIKMCQLNFEDLSDRNCEIKVLEIERILLEETISSRQESNPNITQDELRTVRLGTIDILEYFWKTYPDFKFHLVLGSDTFDDVLNNKWKQSSRILAIPIEVISRKDVVAVNLNKISSSENITVHKVDCLSEVSSSAVRGATIPLTMSSLLYCDILSRLEQSISSVLSINNTNSRKVTVDLNVALYPKVLQYIQRNELYMFSKEMKVRQLKTNAFIIISIFFSGFLILQFAGRF